VLVKEMRPLTWALKEVDPVDLHRQSGIHENLHVYYEKGYLLKLLNNIQIHDIENSSSF
jgi:hypothetical protein